MTPRYRAAVSKMAAFAQGKGGQCTFCARRLLPHERYACDDCSERPEQFTSRGTPPPSPNVAQALEMMLRERGIEPPAC